MDNILIVLSVAIIVWFLERQVPDVQLHKVEGWYLRAFIFNGAQAIIAYAGTHLWDKWFSQMPVLSLGSMSFIYQILVGYLMITFIYYWWHRLRHSNLILWRFLHQFHHSPVRIEIITSFYKSPLEILINGILSSAILFIILGLSAEAVGVCVLMTALAEFVYHMNIKTPRIMGIFFQRPEMHRIHHQQGFHHYNYSDLPVWDMLFGTYSNPVAIINETGFPNSAEKQVIGLLKGQRFKS